MSAMFRRNALPSLSVWLVVIAMALLVQGVVKAEAKPDLRGIEQVIRAQLGAFADNDDEAAFRYASPAIQNGFSSPRAFGDMVRQRYPAVYDASTVRFREQVPHPGFLVQRVQLVGPNGLYWDAYYRMEQQDGEWRIGGVVLTEVAGGI